MKATQIKQTKTDKKNPKTNRKNIWQLHPAVMSGWSPKNKDKALLSHSLFIIHGPTVSVSVEWFWDGLAWFNCAAIMEEPYDIHTIMCEVKWNYCFEFNSAQTLYVLKIIVIG